ncbi:MAG TPA: hypothetical protein VFI02_13600 [Armatimonadota bacterium]|nr:hypothetical protein [Armatimonadota bacterium]
MSWAEVNKNRWERIRDLMQMSDQRRQHGWGMLQQGLGSFIGQREARAERKQEQEMPGIQAEAQIGLEESLGRPGGVRYEENRAAERYQTSERKAGEGFTTSEREAVQEWEENVYLPWQKSIAAAGRSNQNVFAGGEVKDWSEMLKADFQDWKVEMLGMHPEWFGNNGMSYNIPEEGWALFRDRAIEQGIPEYLVDSFIRSLQLASETGEGGDKDISGGTDISYRAAVQALNAARAMIQKVARQPLEYADQEVVARARMLASQPVKDLRDQDMYEQLQLITEELQKLLESFPVEEGTPRGRVEEQRVPGRTSRGHK